MCARLEPHHQVKLYAAHVSPIAETNNVTVSRAGDDFMDCFLIKSYLYDRICSIMDPLLQQTLSELCGISVSSISYNPNIVYVVSWHDC